jgi:hypothetical protein
MLPQKPAERALVEDLSVACFLGKLSGLVAEAQR